jgi:5-methylthioadenosine/S-adenosylhomocysteine deaminase
MAFEMVVHNGTIVTADSNFNIIEDGYIGVNNGRIEAIASKTDTQPLPQADETIDATGGIIIPGLINTHTHLPMTLFRGLADDLPLNVWLEKHIFPAEAAHVNPNTVRCGTLLACVEMLLSGTTTCCDGYFYEDIVAETVKETGMRAVLAQGVIDFPAPGVPDPSQNVQTAAAYAEKWSSASPLITPSIFCHSPYTCSEKTLQKAKTVANEKDLLFQVHLAETKFEYDQIISEQGLTPVQHLDKIGILDERTLLVHCVWLSDDDIDIIAGRKAKVSHAPESNTKLSSGIAPVHKMIEAEIPVGLGTDGCASNNNMDLFLEMDMAAKLHKVNTLDPTVMDARTVFKTVTIEAAKALGREGDIGSLEIGKQADLVILDADQPHLVPMYNPISHIVYAAKGSDVRDVVVSGRRLVRHRQPVSIDMDAVLAQTNSISRSIKSSSR